MAECLANKYKALGLITKQNKQISASVSRAGPELAVYTYNTALGRPSQTLMSRLAWATFITLSQKKKKICFYAIKRILSE